MRGLTLAAGIVMLAGAAVWALIIWWREALAIGAGAGALAIVAAANRRGVSVPAELGYVAAWPPRAVGHVLAFSVGLTGPAWSDWTIHNTAMARLFGFLTIYEAAVFGALWTEYRHDVYGWKSGVCRWAYVHLRIARRLVIGVGWFGFITPVVMVVRVARASRFAPGRVCRRIARWAGVAADRVMVGIWWLRSRVGRSRRRAWARPQPVRRIRRGTAGPAAIEGVVLARRVVWSRRLRNPGKFDEELNGECPAGDGEAA